MYLSNKRLLAAVGRAGRGRLSISGLYAAGLCGGCMVNGAVIDRDGFKRDFGRFWNKYGLPKRGVRLVIESSQFMIRRISAPPVGGRRLEKIIRAEFGDTGAISEPVYDYMTVRHTKEQVSAEVLAAAADRSFIKDCADIMSEMRIKISSIIPAQCANLRLMELYEELWDKTCVICWIDGGNLSCMLAENVRYVYSSRTRLLSGAGTDEYAAEIIRTLSGIMRFQATRRTGRSISDIYFGGITEADLERVRADGRMRDTRVSLFPNGQGIRLPSTVKTDGEEISAAVSNFIPVLGNLAGGLR